MVEIVGLLAISWALVWFFEKGDLSVLGLYPANNRLKNAGILFVITAICCSSGFFMRMYFGEERFALNPNISATMIFTGVWLTMKSVLFEELLCRGVGLYLLIKALGQKWAILISALVFGILHLFNPGVLDHPVSSFLLFAFTFTMGLLLAYAYAKSFSLYLPIAIHFGWNLIQNFVFSEGDSGGQLFVTVQPAPEVTVSYVVYFSMILFPKASAMALGYFFVKKRVAIAQ
jgi:membrane protease YdiL (CAAX protease family)